MAIKSINAQGGDIILINNEVLDDKTLSIINNQFNSVSAELNDLSIITREQWLDIFEISSIISTDILSDIDTISDNITTINSNITTINSNVNTLSDIVNGLTNATRFIGIASTDATIDGETNTTIKLEGHEQLHTIQDGDIVIFGNAEYIAVRSNTGIGYKWVKLGDESVCAQTLEYVGELSTNLKNANLISATSISETTGTKNYELSNSIVKINNVQIGNQWIKTTDNTIGGIKIELVGGDCDFNIGNNNAERDLVLETNNNSSNIKLNSKTIAAKAVKYDNWNNIEDKSDNTLVPKSYVDTSVTAIQESVNNKIKINNTPVETLSFKITDEIPATPVENEFYLVTDSTLNMYGNKITNVADPENKTDVATKEYVDNNIGILYRDISTYLTLSSTDLQTITDLTKANLSATLSNTTSYDNVNVKYIRTTLSQLLNKTITDKNITLKQFAFVNRSVGNNSTNSNICLVVCYWNNELSRWRPVAYSNQFDFVTTNYYLYNLTLTHTNEKQTISPTEELLICILTEEQKNIFINPETSLTNTNINFGIRVNNEYGIPLFGTNSNIPNLTTTPNLTTVVPVIQLSYEYDSKIYSYSILRDLLANDLIGPTLDVINDKLNTI